jgi:hypothetical protein
MTGSFRPSYHPDQLVSQPDADPCVRQPLAGQGDLALGADASEAILALGRVGAGWRVTFDGDFPVLTNELAGEQGRSRG